MSSGLPGQWVGTTTQTGAGGSSGDWPTNIRYGPTTRDATSAAVAATALAGGADIVGSVMQNQANMDMLKSQQAWSETQAEKANAFTEKMASSAREFDRLMAENAMRFSERMAGTTHQREMADLRAAGLNPMLAVMGGAGAPSPSGVSASSPSPSGQQASSPSAIAQKNIFQGLTSSAIQTAQLIKQFEMLDSQVELLDTQASKLDEERNLTRLKAQTELNVQDKLRADTQATIANSTGTIMLNEMLTKGNPNSKMAGVLKFLTLVRGILK